MVIYSAVTFDWEKQFLVHSITAHHSLCTVLQQFHSPIHSKFSKIQCSLFQFPVSSLSLRSSSSCLCLLPHLLVSSSFPSVTHLKRQFLCTLWPNQLAFLLFIVCRIHIDPNYYSESEITAVKDAIWIFKVMKHDRILYRWGGGFFSRSTEHLAK